MTRAPRTTGTWLLTLGALVGFASNSLLCRLALGARSIDAASFTLVRVTSGAIVLGLLRLASGEARVKGGGLRGATALLVYAVLFSFGYVRLATGTGALLLFGAVQLTMIGAGVKAGERPRPIAWLGIAAALGGLVVLIAPGLSAPDLASAGMMVAAGAAWGIYSLLGRGAVSPLAATATNFALGVPIALVVWLSSTLLGAPHASVRGLVLASASGALASGVGYSLWYAALRGLDATRAAVVQLCVPVFAAAAGVAMLGEPVTARLAIATVAVLGGVVLVLRAR